MMTIMGGYSSFTQSAKSLSVALIPYLSLYNELIPFVDNQFPVFVFTIEGISECYGLYIGSPKRVRFQVPVSWK